MTNRSGADATCDLMNRYARGDNSAFSELYRMLAPKLYGFLLRQTRDPVKSEDLLQQTMLQLHCVRGRFLSGSAVTPWAFAIARRILIDNHRGTRREPLLGEAPPGQEPIAGEPTDDVLHTKRVARIIERELYRLPATQRIAFELMQREGLSLREIAEELGTTETAIKLRAHRARTALRAAIGPSDEMVA